MSAQVFVCEGVTVKHFRDLEEVNYSKHLYFLGLYFHDDTFFWWGDHFQYADLFSLCEREETS